MTTSTSKIRLSSKRLAIDIALPGVCYKGSRFDWSSFITQVTLDDAHTFCGAEDSSESDGGLGLCCEFGTATAVAFHLAAAGERFVKPGVGLLTRPDAAPYSFFASYAVDPFDIDTDIKATSVTFTIQPRNCNGYAMRQVRRIEVKDNTLRMTVQLQNIGTQPIHTQEYCHNFVAINGQGPGPDLTLTTGFNIDHEQARDLLEIHQNKARWEQHPKRPFFLHGGPIRRPPGVYWKLKHEPTGVGMAESGTFPMDCFALWGCGHVVSPEVFAAIDVRPGEIQAWHREFTFFKPGDIEPSATVEGANQCEAQVFSVTLPRSGSRRTSHRVSAR